MKNTSERFYEANEDEHTDLPPSKPPRKVWKTVATFDNYQEADSFRNHQAGKAKVRYRPDGSFDVKSLVR